MTEFPKQLLRHRPEEGVYGDCHRTVVACIMGLRPQDVPHFCEDNPNGDVFRERVEEFLSSHNLTEFHVAYQHVSLELLLETMGVMNADRYWILGGYSRTGCNHSVICRGGEIVHDPSLTGSGIVGPMDDGYFWVSVLALQPRGTTA